MATITRRGFLLTAGAAVLAPPPTNPIRLGIVGTGHRAWAHIAILKTMPDFRITALADPTVEFRERAAALAGPSTAVYSDYRRMLAEHKELDAALVVVPNFLHAEVTLAALSQGLHVCCEKPMATTVEDANRMIAAAGRAGKILQIGQQHRYNPLHQKMAQLIREGAIGAVEFVSGNLYRGDWNPRSWRYTDPRTGVATNWRFLTHTAGSSLLEDGIHEIDVLHWMIGHRIARVFATGGNNVFQARETIDHAGLLMEYESGVKCNFNFSLFAPNAGPVGRQMVLIGTEGVMQPEAGQIALRKKADKGPELIAVTDPGPNVIAAKAVGPEQDKNTYRALLAFAQSVTTGRPPFCSGEVGKEAIKISLLAEKSLRERRIVNWNELPA